MPRIALNGLGRMGKLALRDLIDTGAEGDLVLINEHGEVVERRTVGCDRIALDVRLSDRDWDRFQARSLT